jgi:membrane-bound ClpP family serine protease
MTGLLKTGARKLKRILNNKQYGKLWNGLVGLVAGSCEHGDEPTGFVNAENEHWAATVSQTFLSPWN